jgi:amino-acid N-acetyltransferase
VSIDPAKPVQRFEDLRGILRYVPQFRQRVFVINIDGAVMKLPGFAALLQDVAVLQSLNIEVVLVFGARCQIQDLATRRGIAISNDDGMGRTDAGTMELAIEAITRQASELMADLTALELPVVISSALAVHPAGVIDGVDQEFTGRIERVDVESLQTLLKADILPIVMPLGYDGRGVTLRLNSDAVAMELAVALNAAKIIFVSESGLTTQDGGRIAQLSVAGAREIFKKRDPRHDVNMLSKLRYGAMACQEGVPRVHIVDGTQDEALLAELFSNEGVGTMIHADDYQQIRKASPNDVATLLSMMEQSMDDAALVPRSREQLQSKISDFFVLELDGNPIGCVAVHCFDAPDQSPMLAELACLFVRRSHKNKGHAQKLVTFAEETARQKGCQRLFALSTQAFRFFEEKAGFTVSDPQALPPARREQYERSGRNSKVLVKDLKA